MDLRKEEKKEKRKEKVRGGRRRKGGKFDRGRLAVILRSQVQSAWISFVFSHLFHSIVLSLKVLIRIG